MTNEERALRLYEKIQFKGKSYALGLINDAFSIVGAEAIAALREENARLREAATEMAEAVALLPAVDGRILGLLPVLCRLRAALASARPAPTQEEE